MAMMDPRKRPTARDIARAAGVSVAVIAAIVWNTIRDQANTDPTVPVAPTP